MSPENSQHPRGYGAMEPIIGRTIQKAIEALKSAVNGDFVTAKVSLRQLQTINFDRWSDVEKAQLNYFGVRLAAHGLPLDQEIVNIVAVTPQSSEALVWYYAAQKEVHFPYLTDLPSEDFDGKEYLAWKLGIGSRPTIDPWKEVP